MAKSKSQKDSLETTKASFFARIEVPMYLKNLDDRKLFPKGSFSEEGKPIGAGWSAYNEYGKRGPLLPLFERVQHIVDLYEEREGVFPKSPVIVKASQGSPRVCMRHYNRIYQLRAARTKELEAENAQLKERANLIQSQLEEFQKSYESLKRDFDEVVKNSSFFGFSKAEIEAEYLNHLYELASATYRDLSKTPEESFADKIYSSQILKETIQKYVQTMSNARKFASKCQVEKAETTLVELDKNIEKSKIQQIQTKIEKIRKMPERDSSGRFLPKSQATNNSQNLTQNFTVSNRKGKGR